MAYAPSSDPPIRDGYRFGRFEARIRTGFLLREGKRVRIEELPFQLLIVLLETPGQVVSREGLRDRLWGQKTFGSLDNSLHVAVAKLREALGEKAGEPRFIETVRGRGYQFIGEVEPVFDPPAPSLAGPIAPAAAPETPDPETLRLRSRLRLRTAFIALAAIASLAAIVFSIYGYMRRPLIDSQDKVVIGGFTNHTGDDSYNGLAFVFRTKMEESPYLSVIADRRFRQIVKEPDSAQLQDELHACLSLTGQVLLTGEIIAQSSGYQVLITARKCEGGRLLNTEKARADAKDHVLSALDQATGQMRLRLGESESSLQKFNVPLAQATTGSLAALKAFTLGEEKRAMGQEFESISDYKLAIDLDPQFALAYARLGTIYSNAAEMTQSSAYFKKAFEMRERTTDRERLYIAAHYYSVATGEIQRSIDAYEIWRSLYPRDESPANNLGVEYLSIGQPEKALEVTRAAVQIDASSGFLNAVLARAYLESGNYPETQALCSDVAHGNSDVIMLHEDCYLLAFVQNDSVAMQRQLQWAHGNPAESELIDEAAWVAMYRGKIGEAQLLFDQAREIALKNNFAELAALVDLDEAGLDADLGYTREAKEHALDALKLAPDAASTQASAALALARAGDIPRAQNEAEKATAQAPLDTILNDAEVASVRAAIQLQRHNPDAAIQSLEISRPFDLCSAMGLAPAYYRGLAYLEGNQFDKAVKEFQRVIDNRALAADSPYVGLAYLKMGRALQLAGDSVQAAVAYQEAQNIWKDADPGFLPRKQLDSYLR